jgi:hypothetical protein
MTPRKRGSAMGVADGTGLGHLYALPYQHAKKCTGPDADPSESPLSLPLPKGQGTKRASPSTTG